MKPVTTLMSLPLEIHTEILRHVLKAKHIRLLHESTHIAVREPKHSAILLTCKYFHKNFSTLLSQGSCAMLGFSFMFDEELEEADVEYDPESNRGLSIPCSLVDFNTHNEVQTFLTGKNGKRLLGLGELELRSIESEDVYDILSSLDGKIGVKKLTWTSGETETLSQEAATSQSTSIPKDLILDPQNAHLHVPSQEDEGIQHNARMWSFLHNICNADVNVRIEFGLSHWVTCQTKPEIRHKLHGVSDKSSTSLDTIGLTNFVEVFGRYE